MSEKVEKPCCKAVVYPDSQVDFESRAGECAASGVVPPCPTESGVTFVGQWGPWGPCVPCQEGKRCGGKGSRKRKRECVDLGGGGGGQEEEEDEDGGCSETLEVEEQCPSHCPPGE